MSDTKKPGGNDRPPLVVYESEVIIKVAAAVVKKPAANDSGFALR
ncbi:MAG: hypothetical protein PW845_18410 [Pseudomonas sp.]|nr:hypothetical protein [Pseudomonas sp. PIA16]MDE1167287.1 hypothetical protein [Pseudomonas sp.]